MGKVIIIRNGEKIVKETECNNEDPLNLADNMSDLLARENSDETMYLVTGTDATDVTCHAITKDMSVSVTTQDLINYVDQKLEAL